MVACGSVSYYFRRSSSYSPGLFGPCRALLLCLFMDAVSEQLEIETSLEVAWPFLELRLLNERLQKGEGTLIVLLQKHGLRLTWWTADNVIGSAPKKLPQDFFDVYEVDEKVLDFAADCAEKYCNANSGKALLTDGLNEKAAKRFSKNYPSTNVATIICTPKGVNLISEGHPSDRYSQAA